MNNSKSMQLDRAVLLHHSGSRELFDGVRDRLSRPVVDAELRRFPDGESYVRIQSDVIGHDVLLVCSLDRPDPKLPSLLFTAETVREQGARNVVLVAPYLSYMRQDRAFQPGEAVTSRIFADLISRHFEGLITIDPHLHRYETLAEIYSLPARTIHAGEHLSLWIDDNVEQPLLVGPDSESRQWVSRVAERIGAPWEVLEKTRHGDREVEVQLEGPLPEATGRTPVLIDDIISTASTMIQATRVLLGEGLPAPVCVGIHGLFTGDSYEQLRQAGADRVVTCNTVEHPSNKIDVSGILARELGEFMELY